MNLKNKQALVTGGAKRLGRQMCLALAEQGAAVTLHYHKSYNEALAIQKECVERGFSCSIISCDLSSEKERKALVHGLAAAPPDILVNSASLFPEDSLWDWKEEELNRNMSLHLAAARDLSSLFVDRDSPGVIINLLDSRIQDYDSRHLTYHFSKKALYQLTRIMAVELAPLTRVNAIAPGLVLPPEGEGQDYLDRLKKSNPLESHGSAEDISQALLYLIQADFVTGQVIYVDGGRNLKGSFYA